MAHLESLVVLDPQPRTREALSYGFRRDGYKVFATAQGQDALSVAQAKAAQLVVASVPPKVNGFDPLQIVGKLREEPETRELPIVVLGEPSAREAALRAGADEFVARPAFIRDVLTLSKLAVAMRQDGDDSGVAGLLEDYQLYFLVRALSVAGRSGVLELERGRRTGEVHFVKGEVVTARCGRMSGLAALHQLLLWGEAAMHLRMSMPTGERKIHVAIDDLLAEAGRFGQEFEAFAVKVGGTQAVYRQAPRRVAENRTQVPAEVLGMLKLYDGRRQLIDIVEDSPFKALDTIKVTYRLLEIGLIERISEAGGESPLTAQLAVRDWLLGAPVEPERSTVTEAGRRAAEAYAAEQERREHEAAPAAEILDDTERVFALATAPPPPEPKKPKAQKKGGKRPGKKTGRVPKAPPPEPKLDLRPSQPPAQPKVDLDEARTIPFSRMPLELRDPPPPAKAPEPPPPPPAKAEPEPKVVVQKPKAAAQAPRPPKPQARPASRPAPVKDAASRPAPVKEVAFTEVEEAFFAREAELAKIQPVETFDDLEPPEVPKRRWFNFGGKFSSPAPKTGKSPKKR